MITLRPAAARGATATAWLDSRHTFSFGEYSDRRWDGFRCLRVLNDDRVLPASGFPPHPHRDMEIVSIVLDGALEHRDSLGNGSVIRPGEVQRMTAGSGIVHSEWNPSPDAPVHFLQIWLLPRRRGIAPGYAQRPLPAGRDAFALVVSGAPADGVIGVDSDADVWRAALGAGGSASVPLRRPGGAWVHVASGEVTIEASDARGRAPAATSAGTSAATSAGTSAATSAVMSAGDGAAVRGAAEVRVTARTAAEVLVFDLG